MIFFVFRIEYLLKCSQLFRMISFRICCRERWPHRDAVTIWHRLYNYRFHCYVRLRYIDQRCYRRRWRLLYPLTLIYYYLFFQMQLAL